MGTWSADILGGDGPMDTLSTLERLIGHDDLYPLDFTEIEALDVRKRLEANTTKVLEGNPKYPWQSDAWPVIAAAYLASGATMPEGVRDQALASCREEIANLSTINSDGWGDPAERIAVLENHILAIHAHAPGRTTEITHVGLFQAMGRGRS